MSKLKNYCDIYTGNSISDSDKDKYSFAEGALPYISTKDIDLSTHTIDYCNGMYVSDNVDNFKIAPKNSTLLCIEGGSAGKKIGYLKKDVCFVNKLCCFANFKGDSRFLYYYLQSDTFLSEFNLNMTGLIGGVSQSVIKNMTVAFPDDDKQKRIADYLDSKCSKIDQVIEDNNKAIELIEEYKLDIINNKTYCPNIGKKCKLKNICSKITDGAHVSPETDNGVYDFISVVDLNENGEIDFDNCLKTSETSYNQMVRNSCKPEKGDILFSKDGSVGKTSMVDYDKDFVVASSLVILRPKKEIVTQRYLYYYLNNYFIKQTLQSYLTGAGLKRVSIEKNRNLIVYLPEIEEQKKITDYLDNVCPRIDKVIEYRKKIIEKLEEYKKSLIYEVVTGKKEV